MKSILSLKLIQFKNEKKEQKWFNYESKGEHLNLLIIEEKTMADPTKFESVSITTSTYKILKFLGDGKITDAELTISIW